MRCKWAEFSDHVTWLSLESVAEGSCGLLSGGRAAHAFHAACCDLLVSESCLFVLCCRQVQNFARKLRKEHAEVLMIYRIKEGEYDIDGHHVFLEWATVEASQKV